MNNRGASRHQFFMPGLFFLVLAAFVMQPLKRASGAEVLSDNAATADQTRAGENETVSVPVAAGLNSDTSDDADLTTADVSGEMPELAARSGMVLGVLTEEDDGLFQAAVNHFQFDPFGGSGIVSLPLYTPPGRAGMQPSLSLIYSPRNGNGLLGVGWQIQFPVIEAATKWGIPGYDSTTRYQANLGGAGMELVNTSADRYASRFFTPGISDFHKDGDQWHAWDKNGRRYEFGMENLLEDDSRVCDPGDSSKCFRFYLSKVQDPNGNYVFYRHFPDGGFEILYTGEPGTDNDDLNAGTQNFALRIVGEVETDPRQDPVISYRGGFETRIDKRLKEIRIYAQSQPIKKYVFTYEESPRTFRTLLKQITEYGADGATSRPPVTFSYQDADEPLYEIKGHSFSFTVSTHSLISGDFNGDGLMDLARTSFGSGNVEPFLSQGETFDFKGFWIRDYIPDGKPLVGDFNADGMTDICVYKDGEWHVAFSDGTQFVDQGVWASGFVSEKYPASGDFDGDGNTDVAAYYKENGIWKARIALNPQKTGFEVWTGKDFIVAPDHVNRFTADVNGDGLTDFVSHSGTTATWFIRLNNGNLNDEFTPIENVNAFCPAEYSGDRQGFLSNITGSGLSDIACWTSDHQPYRGQIGYLTSRSDHFYKTRILPFTFSIVGSNSAVIPTDLNGDGITDYAVYTTSGNSEIAYSRSQFADLLASVNNGIGGMTEIEYEPSSNHPNTYMPMVIPVVKSTTVSNSRGDAYTTRYDYSGGLWDSQAREFFGFETVKVIDPEGHYTQSRFRQDDAYLKGRLKEQTRYSSTNQPRNKATNTWTVETIDSSAEPPVKFTYLARTDNFVYNNSGDTKRTAQEFHYDETPQLGNVTKVIQLGEVNPDNGADIGSDTRTVETEYVKNTAGADIWLHGLPKQTTVKNDAGETMRRSWFYYDNSDDINATPLKGLLTKKVDWAGDKPGTEHPETRYAYNAYGNLTSTVDARNNATAVAYDNEFHIFPTVTTNALEHQIINEYYGIAGVPLDSGDGYAGLWGQLKSTTDPNGQTSRRVYDTFGRPIKNIGPLDSLEYPSSQLEYTEADTYIKIISRQRTEHGQPDTVDSVEYYDGLGRLIQAKTVSADADQFVVSGQTEYNSRGLPEKKYIPRFTSLSLDEIDPIDPGQPHTFIHYDTVGRVTQTVNPDGTFSDADYDNWTVSARDENGHQQKSYFDAYGRLVKKEEYQGADGRCAEYPQQAYTLYAATVYAYDSEGNLVQTKDAHNNLTVITYDKLGRKIAMDDPDMGTWQYGYDLNGNLVWQRDAKLHVLSFEHDALNRLKNKNDGSTFSVDYYYDDPAIAFSKGRLTSVHYGLNDRTEFYYDALGREIKSVKTINGAGYTVERKYNALNQLKQVTYPDGKKAFYQYNPAGQVDAVATDESLLGQQSHLRGWQALREALGSTLNWCEKHILGIREVYADEVPAAPVLNSATPGDAQVVLDWDPVSGALGYEVRYYETEGSSGFGIDFTQDNSCVGGWLMDETSGDVIDACRDNDGVKKKRLLQGVSGQYGNAIEFKGYPDGNNAFVDFGSDPSLDNLRARTIVAWIYPHNPGDYNWGTILDKGEDWGWGVTLANGNRLRFYQGFTGGAVTWVTSFDSVQMNVWQHIAVTYSAGGLDDEPVFYVNGVPQNVSLASSEPYGDFRSDAGNDLHGGIGRNRSYEFDGVIDELAVFSRALSAEEIETIMLNGLTGGGSGVPVIIQDAGDVTKYAVMELVNGTEYSFSVRAYNGEGSGAFSNELSAVPQSGLVLPPVSPDLISADAGNGSVTLNWSTVSGAEGYKVYHGTVSGSYSQDIDAGDVNSYTVSGLGNGTTYYFAVSAFNTAGESAVSNELSAVPVDDNPVVNGSGTILREVWLNVLGSTLNNLIADPRFPDEPDIQHEISALEGPTGFAEDYGTRIRGYVYPPYSGNYTFWIAGDDESKLYLSPDTDPAAKQLIARVPEWTNYHEWNKYGDQESGPIQMIAGQAYYIEALHKEGNLGDHISVAWEKPDGEFEVIPGQYLSPVSVQPQPPSAPVLTSADAGDGYVSLAWSAVVNADGYNLYYGTSSGSYSQDIDAGDVNSYTVSGLGNGTTYYFAVSAFNTAGESAVSNELSAVPYAAPPEVPDAPVMNAPFAGDSRVDLNWDAVDGADNYTIRYSTMSGGGSVTDFTQDSSCVGGWLMDETSGDVIDACNNNDGVKSGYILQGVAGQYGNAIEFLGYPDGNNAFVNFGSDASLDNVGARTVAAWIYPHNVGDYNWGTILDKGEDRGWGVTLSSNNRLRFYQGFTGGAVTWVTSSDSVQMNTWQHIAVTYSAAGLDDEPVFYVNGIPQDVRLASSEPYGDFRSDAGYDLHGGIGAYHSYEFDGVIDELAVFNRVLSAQEINALMSFGLNGAANSVYEAEFQVGDVNHYTISGLNNDTTYYFIVTASNSAGESPLSNEVSATPFAVVEAPVNYISHVAYNAVGQKTRIEYANGTVTAYEYHPQNLRLTRMSTVSAQSEVLQDLVYLYDAAGNIVEIVDNVNTADQSFEYDALNRLVQASGYQYGTKVYAHDEIGNILSKDGVQYFYGENGAGPHAVTSLDNGTVFAYDGNGNMSLRQQAGEVTEYLYDAENRLRLVRKNGGTIAEYEYDGDGGRTQKQSLSGTGWTTTRFIGSLFEITPERISRYIYLGGQRIAAVNNGETAYYFSDHLGGLNVATDESGEKLEIVEYTPFGSLSRQDKFGGGGGGDPAQHYFTGQRLDDETGLYYYGARYYDPSLGRFITADSVVPGYDNPQALNRYSYCLNNPVNRVDPSGHWSWNKFWKAAVGAIVGIASAVVLGPAGIGLGLTMAGMIGGAVGGGISGGLNNGWQGALMGAGLGGVLGGIGGWGIDKFGWEFSAGMLIAGAGVAGATDSWDSFTGGFIGGLCGAALGNGFIDAYPQHFKNFRAGDGFRSDKDVALEAYIKKIEALNAQNVNQKNIIVKRISRPLAKNNNNNPGSTTGPHHNAIISKSLKHDVWEMGPENGLIQTTNTVGNLNNWGTHGTTQRSLALGGDYIESLQISVNADGLQEAIALYEIMIAGNFEYSAFNHNSNFAVNSVLYGAGGDIPLGGNAVGRAPGFPDAP